MKTLLLFAAGVIALIGAGQFFAPARFHALNGIVITDVNLLSEVRAAGALLLALGVLIGIGAFRDRRSALGLAALAYLSYGGARLFALAVDGVPTTGLLVVTAVELAFGVVCAWARVKSP